MDTETTIFYGSDIEEQHANATESLGFHGLPLHLTLWIESKAVPLLNRC